MKFMIFILTMISTAYCEYLPFDQSETISTLAERRRDPIEYTKTLSRFKQSDQYDHSNAAALVEINFNCTIAGANDNLEMPIPIGFDQAVHLSYGRTTYGYIVISEKQQLAVLTLTGTASLLQALNNLDFRLTAPHYINNYQEGMLIHHGFYRLYTAIQEQIHEQIAKLRELENLQLVISGFSLGGGLACLAALDLSEYKPIVYTFAAPRTGNPTFAKIYNHHPSLSHTWRVFNTEDKVPNLPPPLTTLPPTTYEHVGNPVPFTRNTGDKDENHVEVYYYTLVEMEPPSNPNGICPNRYDCSQR